MRPTPPTALALLLALGASNTLAQPEDETPMPGSAERVRQAQSVLPRVGTNTTPVMPTRAQVSLPVDPGLTEGHDWTKVLNDSLDRHTAANTLAEGTFLLDRAGSLVRGPSNRLIFVPDHHDRQAGEGPMLVLPCSITDQLDRSWTGQRVLVRGEVFLYHGRNYLLPAWFSLVAVDADAETQPGNDTPTNDQSTDQSTGKTESPAADTPGDEPTDIPASMEDDPQVEALLRELEAELPSNPDDRAAHAELASDSPARPSRAVATASGIREGTILVRRRGRMERQPDGSWALVFDNDEASDLGAESLTLLPCRMLTEMESLTTHDGGIRELIVSGRVYASMGQGYLLPTLIQRVRPEGISPRQ